MPELNEEAKPDGEVKLIIPVLSFSIVVVPPVNNPELVLSKFIVPLLVIEVDDEPAQLIPVPVVFVVIVPSLIIAPPFKVIDEPSTPPTVKTPPVLTVSIAPALIYNRLPIVDTTPEMTG